MCRDATAYLVSTKNSANKPLDIRWGFTRAWRYGGAVAAASAGDVAYGGVTWVYGWLPYVR
jgi:hypothetical protein